MYLEAGIMYCSNVSFSATLGNYSICIHMCTKTYQGQNIVKFSQPVGLVSANSPLNT